MDSSGQEESTEHDSQKRRGLHDDSLQNNDRMPAGVKTVEKQSTRGIDTDDDQKLPATTKNNKDQLVNTDDTERADETQEDAAACLILSETRPTMSSTQTHGKGAGAAARPDYHNGGSRRGQDTDEFLKPGLPQRDAAGKLDPVRDKRIEIGDGRRREQEIRLTPPVFSLPEAGAKKSTDAETAKESAQVGDGSALILPTGGSATTKKASSVVHVQPGAYAIGGINARENGNDSVMEDDDLVVEQDRHVQDQTHHLQVEQDPVSDIQQHPVSTTLMTARPVVDEEDPLPNQVVTGQAVKDHRKRNKFLIGGGCLLLVGAIAGVVIALTTGSDASSPGSQSETLTDLFFTFTGMEGALMTTETIAIWEETTANFFLEAVSSNPNISDVTSSYMFAVQDRRAYEVQIVFDQKVSYRTISSLFNSTEIAATPFDSAMKRDAYLTALKETGHSAFANFESVSPLQSSLVQRLPGEWSQLGQDIVGNGGGDLFGWSIAVSADGSVVAVGGIFNDVNGMNAGQARVFRWNGSSWVQRGQTLVGEVAGDEFGRSVSLSSDASILAVGAANRKDAGHVRVFQLNGSVWVPFGKTLVGDTAGDRFGWSTALSSDGHILAVGAQLNDNNGKNAGQVQVFHKLNETSWVPLGQALVGESSFDRFGFSVSLSSDGSILAAGADGHDGNGEDSGHLRVFQLKESIWVPLGDPLVGEESGDRLGISTSLSSDGSIMAVGAPYNNGNGADSGHVRVYQLQVLNNESSSWVQLGQPLVGANATDQFGWAVSLSSGGSTLAVGANRNQDFGSFSGHVRVFRWLEGAWAQVAQTIPGLGIDDRFGISVALSANGTIVSAGADQFMNTEEPPGYARVYQFS